MDETNRTARIAMMWTPTLKEAVRDAAGPGGMTDFVIEAVEAKLATIPEEEVPAFVPPREPIETHVREVWKEPVAPPEGKPTNLTLEEALEPPKVKKDRDDLFARVMAKAGNTDELEKNKDKFTTASELKAIKGAHSLRIDDGAHTRIVDEDACPKCGSELIDGECWTCL